MEARLLSNATDFSGYPEEYLISMIETYAIVPVVVDLDSNSIEAIQPWNPQTGESWLDITEASAWATSWIEANRTNVDEVIVDIASIANPYPELENTSEHPRLKSAK